MKYKKSYISRIVRWLRRIRHRCGYGIHSPFAFGFVKDVVYSPGRFYAYEHLESICKKNAVTAFRLKDILLIFRLANFVRPNTCRLLSTGADEMLQETIHAASRNTAILPPGDNTPASLTIAGDWDSTAPSLVGQLSPESVLLLIATDISSQRRKVWREIKKHPNARVTFDLGDFGIVFNTAKLLPQDYVVNYF